MHKYVLSPLNALTDKLPFLLAEAIFLHLLLITFFLQKKPDWALEKDGKAKVGGGEGEGGGGGGGGDSKANTAANDVNSQEQTQPDAAKPAEPVNEPEHAPQASWMGGGGEGGDEKCRIKVTTFSFQAKRKKRAISMCTAFKFRRIQIFFKKSILRQTEKSLLPGQGGEDWVGLLGMIAFNVQTKQK